MGTYQQFSFLPPKQPVRLVNVAEGSQLTYTLMDCSSVRSDGTEITTTPLQALDGQLIRPNHTAHHYVPSAVRSEMLCPVNQQYNVPVIPPPGSAVSVHIAGQYNPGYQFNAFTVKVTVRRYWINQTTSATGSVVGQYTFLYDEQFFDPLQTPVDFMFFGGAADLATGSLTLDATAQLIYSSTTSGGFYEVSSLGFATYTGQSIPSGNVESHCELLSVDEVSFNWVGPVPPNEGNYPGFNPGQDYIGFVTSLGANINDPVADNADSFVRVISEGYSFYRTGFCVGSVTHQQGRWVTFKGPLSSVNIANGAVDGFGIGSRTVTYTDSLGTGQNGAFDPYSPRVPSLAATWENDYNDLDPTPNAKPYIAFIRAWDTTTNQPVNVTEVGGTSVDGVLGRPSSSPSPSPTPTPTVPTAVSAVGEGVAAFTDNTPLAPTGFAGFDNGGYQSGEVDVGVIYPAVYHSGLYSVSDLGEKAKRVQGVDLSFDNLQGLQVPTKFSQFPITFSAHTAALYETGVPDQVSGDVFFPDLYDNPFYNRNTLETNVANVAFKGHTSSFKFGVWSLDAATWVLNTATIRYTLNNTQR